MTAQTAGHGRWRPPAPEAPPVPPSRNWPMIAVILTVVGMAATAVASDADLKRRVAQLEQQNPPGMLQRIDERTLQMQETLKRLEARP